jgi:dGTPase
MPRTREELEAIERRNLAPYAQMSGDSRGRAHPEPPPEWRTEFQRDRDRVIHSRAFRRLEYKTQVFLNGTGDHLRTRLTHTMEVAAITRGIARALRLNEDLGETIALAHDLGHSPFGHRGEAALNRLMKGRGGFEHNRHSLRIVEELEHKYPGFPGLNLTWETREGLAKHVTTYDRPGTRRGFAAKSPSLEAQVANLADELTYSTHDLDDGLESGLLSEKQLERDLPLWREAARRVRRGHGDLEAEVRRSFTIRTLIDLQVCDAVEATEARILASGIRTADDARRQPRHLVGHSPARQKLNLSLRKFLYKNLYFNPRVDVPNSRAVRMLEDLFRHYLAHPEQVSEHARKRFRKVGKHRAICDYLAGMTDRYALLDHARIFGPQP